MDKEKLIRMYIEQSEKCQRLGEKELDEGNYNTSAIYFSKASEWLQKAREELNKM